VRRFRPLAHHEPLTIAILNDNGKQDMTDALRLEQCLSQFPDEPCYLEDELGHSILPFSAYPQSDIFSTVNGRALDI
jgi:hypothetical protein